MLEYCDLMTLIYIIYDMQQHACWCFFGFADDNPNLHVSLTTGVKTQYLTNDAELGTTKDSIQVVANSFLEILVVKMQQIGIH